jgi:GntR family transcriptional regulator/MocR family aminotransferase
VAAPVSVIETLGALRSSVDRQGDHVLETAVAELVEDGELQRHAHKMRRIYESRRDALATTLERELADVLTFQLPAGGITLWARVADGVQIAAWQERALARGVAFVSARELSLDGKVRPYIRLAFARYTEGELSDAVRRLRRALDDAKRAAGTRGVRPRQSSC